MPLEVYAVRGEEEDNIKSNVSLTPKEEYEDMTADQFVIFAKVYLKDNMLGFTPGDRSWQDQLAEEDLERMQSLNHFFENIPDDLICFSRDIHRKLLFKYIVSNMRFGYGIDLHEDSKVELFKHILRLTEIDPRIG